MFVLCSSSCEKCCKSFNNCVGKCISGSVFCCEETCDCAARVACCCVDMSIYCCFGIVSLVVIIIAASVTFALIKLL